MTEENYEKLFKTLSKAISELYYQLNDYLENIFNSPSTINKIMKYYAIGFDPTETNKRYIMFGGTVVREYVLELPRRE